MADPIVQQTNAIKRYVPTNAVAGVMVPGLYTGATKIPERSFLAFSPFSTKTLVSQATKGLESYMNHEKKTMRIKDKIVLDVQREINFANSKLSAICSKLEKAVKMGDSSPNTRLLLGATYACMGEWSKCAKVCATLAFDADSASDAQLRAHYLAAANYLSSFIFTGIGMAYDSQAQGEASRLPDGKVSSSMDQAASDGKAAADQATNGGKANGKKEEKPKTSVSISDLSHIMHSLNVKANYCYSQAQISEKEAQAAANGAFIPAIFFTLFESKVEYQMTRFPSKPAVLEPANKE